MKRKEADSSVLSSRLVKGYSVGIMLNLKRVERDDIAKKYTWLTAQVEGHLVFGPLSRYQAAGLLLPIIFLIGLVYSISSNDWSEAGLFGEAEIYYNILSVLCVIGVTLFFFMIAFRLSGIQHAIIGWSITKVSFSLFACFITLIGFVYIIQAKSKYTWTNIILGLVWMPIPEFIPVLSRDQKFISITRIILSIPCVYLGIKGGSM